MNENALDWLETQTGTILPFQQAMTVNADGEGAIATGLSVYPRIPRFNQELANVNYLQRIPKNVLSLGRDAFLAYQIAISS